MVLRALAFEGTILSEAQQFFENGFQAINLAAGIVTLDPFESAAAKSASQLLITQELVQPRREQVDILPRYEVTVLAVRKPLADPPGIEGNDRQSIAHSFGSGHSEGLGPE